MKTKLVSSALALSLLFGGAAVSSSSVEASTNTKHISTNEISKSSEVTPQVWGALGRAAAKGAAWGVGWVAGEKAAKSVFGSSTAQQADYKYEDVTSSFDL